MIMELIKKLSEHIEDEIADMECYAKLAIEVKEEYPVLAESLYSISTQEENHMKILHEKTEAIIKKYRETNGEVPSDMMVIYEYLHKRHIEEYEKAKRYQQMYKN